MGWDRWSMYQAQKRLETHTEFYSEDLKVWDHLGDTGTNGRILLKEP
jgi:hypothetical protein